MAVKTRIVDLGWARIREDLAELGLHKIEVGIQAGDGAHGGDVADIAAQNEFGAGPVPARPFMRTSFDENEPGLVSASAKLAQAVIDGRFSPDQSARMLGELHQNQVVAKIDEIRTPKNSPATIAAKGSSKPLIDTGDMRAAVRYGILIEPGRGEREG